MDDASEFGVGNSKSMNDTGLAGENSPGKRRLGEGLLHPHVIHLCLFLQREPYVAGCELLERYLCDIRGDGD